MNFLTLREAARWGGLGLLCAFTMGTRADPLYNLVEGLDKFHGSTAAWHLLETNGFVVTDPDFKTIFEPYTDNLLPVFITADSAWQTYHGLFEQGVAELHSRNVKLPEFVAPSAWLTNALIATNPSGLDFIVASTSPRSEAAVRALRATEGGAAAVDALESQPPPSLPDSLSADAMRLMAALEQPLPRGIAPAFRSEAWMDLQLWTQLGAWTEECHPAGVHPKRYEESRADTDAPKGLVAPYPEFFSRLAALTRQTRQALADAGLDETFDSKTAARRLLDGVLSQENSGANPGFHDEATERRQQQMVQFDQFIQDYRDTHPREFGVATQNRMNDLEALARRCLTDTPASEPDLTVLRAFFENRQTVPQLLGQFASVCDELALLARKCLEGVVLTDHDQTWIGRYGITLARFSFGSESPPTQPTPDDFPIVDSLCANAAGRSVFHAALGRPKALYIILPLDGRLRLFRGAVIAYREFVRPASQVLTDESWRTLETTGAVPPSPPFTRTFYVERNADELLATFDNPPEDSQEMDEQLRNLSELKSRVTDRDLPALIAALGKNPADSPLPLAAGIATAIGELNWAPRQRELLAIIDKNDSQSAQPVLEILFRRPEWLNIKFLCANFNAAPPRARRVYCALLAQQPMDAQIRATVLTALRDSSAAVRWQAALALAKVSPAAEDNTPPLMERLTDTNPPVAAAAAYALGRGGATQCAPALLVQLEQFLAAPDPSEEESEKAAEVIRDSALITPGQTNLMDPEGLAMRLRPGLGRMRRFGGPFIHVSFDEFTPANALIEALGELKYQPAEERIYGLLDGSHIAAAAKALKQLAPEKLSPRLAAIACDKNAGPSVRDDALLLLTSYPTSDSVTLLTPLLEDATIIPSRRLMPGRDWRICDRAASTIASLLGRSLRITPMQSSDLRDKQIEEVRQWLKSAY